MLRDTAPGDMRSNAIVKILASRASILDITPRNESELKLINLIK
jgi:DNA-directed RNA polymerase subunit F